MSEKIKNAIEAAIEKQELNVEPQAVGKEELNALAERIAAEDGELSDDELDAVAGGVSTSSASCAALQARGCKVSSKLFG